MPPAVLNSFKYRVPFPEEFASHAQVQTGDYPQSSPERAEQIARLNQELAQKELNETSWASFYEDYIRYLEEKKRPIIRDGWTLFRASLHDAAGSYNNLLLSSGESYYFSEINPQFIMLVDDILRDGLVTGAITPQKDGTFDFSDLEADVYPLRIIYIGGLTSDATESGYQDYERNVIAREGGAVDLGQVVLELGLGTIQGTLDPGGNELPSDATVVLKSSTSLNDGFRIPDEKRYEVRPDETGGFQINNVQVGEYTMFVIGDGLTSCFETVVVAQHTELVERPSFAAPSTTVRFSAGTSHVEIRF